MKRICPLVLPLAVALACAAIARCAAEEFSDDQAVEAAEQVLGGWGGVPWYDPQAKDHLRFVPVQSFEPPPRPEQWEPPTSSTQSSWWQDLWRNVTGFFSNLWNLVGDYRILAFVALVVLVGALILLLRNWKGMQGGRGGQKSSSVKKQASIDRIEALPFKVAPPVGDLFGEAERRYAEGDYRGAVIYYYSYQLVELDKHQKIRLTRGKTNRQYLRELRQRQELAVIVEVTMIAFEEVFFGDHDLSRERFEECWTRASEFQRILTSS